MTKILSNVREIHDLLDCLRLKGTFIKFIPTMGSLHQGHISLIKKAKTTGGKIFLSIFVNPLQFDNSQDYKNYPKDLGKDIEITKDLGVDYVFIPQKETFLKKISSSIKIGQVSKPLCGANRKGHFEGVATVIIKFLNIINPNLIYLGQKDFQQVLVIKKLINDFSIRTKVIICKTLRHKDGLAYSSRNKNLSSIQRAIAPFLFQTLKKIKKKISIDGLSEIELRNFKSLLIKKGFSKINYLEIRTETDLSLLKDTNKICRLFVSANLDKTKLIDNHSLGKIKLHHGKYLKF